MCCKDAKTQQQDYLTVTSAGKILHHSQPDKVVVSCVMMTSPIGFIAAVCCSSATEVIINNSNISCTVALSVSYHQLHFSEV